MGADLEYLKKCPVCDSGSFSFFVKSNDFQVVRCHGCRLLLVNPRPSEAAIRKLFKDEYIGTDQRVDMDFTSMRMASLRREANWLVHLRPGGGRLLDVGTASGAFLRCFEREKNWEVEGLEPSRFGARAAAARTGKPVHRGFLRDQSFSAKLFDVVTSLDAFMFHPEPKEDLSIIAHILKPGGLLAMEIPGLQFRLLKNTGILCRLLYGVPARLNAGVHLFYYSRQTLGRLLGRFGFVEIAHMPEQSPIYGPWYVRVGNALFYGITAVLYRATRGVVNLAPKEFLVYRKEGE